MRMDSSLKESCSSSTSRSIVARCSSTIAAGRCASGRPGACRRMVLSSSCAALLGGPALCSGAGAVAEGARGSGDKKTARSVRLWATTAVTLLSAQRAAVPAVGRRPSSFTHVLKMARNGSGSASR